MKTVFGLWAEIKVSQLNRILRPFNVRLVAKGSREWGDQVAITAHRIVEGPMPIQQLPSGVDGVTAIEMSDGTVVTSKNGIDWDRSPVEPAGAENEAIARKP